MGKYLSHFRNRKASADGLRQPDENYAREVMQLFTIGLIERNLDFTPVLSGGQPIPTYDQNVVTNYAKVFTGFNYNNATSISNGTNTYLRMTCIGGEHDLTAKTLVGGTQVPANQSCPDDVADGLDLLFAHPNVAPFISRQLIQRFTTSSPSPASAANGAVPPRANSRSSTAASHERVSRGAWRPNCASTMATTSSSPGIWTNGWPRCSMASAETGPTNG